MGVEIDTEDVEAEAEAEELDPSFAPFVSTGGTSAVGSLTSFALFWVTPFVDDEAFSIAEVGIGGTAGTEGEVGRVKFFSLFFLDGEKNDDLDL